MENAVNDTLNYFNDFSLWSQLHYFSFTNREKYPNMFLFYFPINGFLIKDFKTNEREKILNLIDKYEDNEINGMWGYISLELECKNGITIYEEINKSEFAKPSISYPCFQDRKCTFLSSNDEKIYKIFEDNLEKYNKIQDEFEKYLIELDKNKFIEYQNFIKEYSECILFSHTKSDIVGLLHKKVNEDDADDCGIFLKEIINENVNENLTPKKNKNKNKKKHLLKNKRIRKEFEEDLESDSESFKRNKNSINSETKEYTPIKEKIYEYNFDNDLEFYQHEQLFDGYTSDFTKKIYKKPITSLSDNENNLNDNENKKIIHRVRNKGKTILKNISYNHLYDYENIGIEREIEKRADKLRRELLQRKKRKFWRRELNYELKQQEREKRRKERNNFLKKRDLDKIIMEKKNQNKKKKILIDEYFNYSSSKRAKSIISISSNISNTDKIYLSDDKSENMSIQSFNSIFNRDYPLEKKRVRKKKNLAFFDNNKNHSIQNFIPIISNSNIKYEKYILHQINKLITNSKFDSLLYYFTQRGKIENIIQQLNSLKNGFESISNNIDLLFLNDYKINEEYHLNQNITISLDSKDENQIYTLLVFYKEKIIQFFSIFLDNNIDLTIEEQQKVYKDILATEHLLKSMIYEKTILSTILDKINNVVSEILINFFSFFVNVYLTKNDKVNSIRPYCQLLYTFILILRALISKNLNEKNKQNESKTNQLINKFLKIFCFSILIQLYKINENDIEKDSNNDNLSLIILFVLLSEVYFFLNNYQGKNISLEMIKILFDEFIFSSQDIDTQTNGELKEIVINDISKYLSPQITYLMKDKFEGALKSNLKKFLLFNTNQIEDTNSLSIELKKIIKDKVLLSLYYRYFLFFFLCVNEHGKEKISFLDYYNNLLKKCVNNSNDSYYNIDILIESISQYNQYKFKYNKDIFEKFLLSDTKLLLFLDTNWIIETNSKLNFIFSLFNIINLPSKKTKLIEPKIITSEIFNIIFLLFNMNDEINENGPIIEFLLNICICFKTSFIKYEIDEKSRIRLFSKFVNNTTPFKSNLNTNDNTKYTIGIIPVISIILCYIEFAIYFTEKSNVEKVIMKIKDILDSEKIRSVMKSFNIAIWFNLIQKIASKNLDIDISQYIEMINLNIHTIILAHNKYISLSDYQQKGSSLLEENNESLKNYLTNFKKICNDNGDICFSYVNILKELKEILNIDIFYPMNLRLDVLEILNILFEKFEKKINEDNNSQELDFDGDKIDLNVYFHDIIEENDISETLKNFLLFIKTTFLPSFDKICNYFISKNNVNVSYQKKIYFTLYENVLILKSKLFGLLIKYKICYKPFDFCVQVLKESHFYKNSSTHLISSILVNNGDIEAFTRLPFKLILIYLKTCPNLIQNQIMIKEYKTTLQYFLQLFYIGTFIKVDKVFLNSNKMFDKYYQMSNQSDEFCFFFIDELKKNEELINQKFFSLRHELKNNKIISERNREELTYYKLYLLIANLNKSEFYLQNVMSKILDEISITRDLDKIESKFFFELLNSDLVNNALERFYYIMNNLEQKSEFMQKILNIKFFIFGRFMDDYLNKNLDNNLTNYIDSFLKILEDEKENILTMQFINKLIRKDPKTLSFNLLELTKKTIIKIFEKCYLIKINESIYNDEVLQFFNKSIEEKLPNDFYYLIFNFIPYLSQIPENFPISVIFYQSIQCSIKSKTNWDLISKFIFEILSKINLKKNIISDLKTFFIYHIILKNILLVFENMYIFTQIPSDYFIDKIQKVYEYYINILYSFSFENENDMNNTQGNNIENILLIFKKENKLLNIGNINIFQNINESEKFIYSKRNIILREALEMSNKYISIFKTSKLNDLNEFEKIKFLEYILYKIKRRIKIIN